MILLFSVNFLKYKNYILEILEVHAIVLILVIVFYSCETVVTD